MLNKIKENVFSIFKRIPLTFKITLWYTSFIVILISSIIIGGFIVRDSIVESTGKKDLIKEVNKISLGTDKFSPYEDGVTLSIYDKEGNLIAGSIPKNFEVKDFSLGMVSEYTDIENNKYMYYDLQVNSAKLGNGKYVRGIVQISSGKINWYIVLLITVGGPLIIAVIMYGGYRIIRNSLRPVREMTQAAEEISKSADLSKRIAVSGGDDEVHRLSIVFNEMLETLENSSKREKQFSSDVSHELRTPISVIMSESEYGKKYIDSVEEARESFEVIERQSKRMNTVINQILEIARLDSNVAIAKENFSFSTKLKKNLEDYKKLFESKGINLIINIEDDISIFGNEVLIMRLVDNLLSNALKYSNSEISITLAKRNSIILEVKDDGVGISDEEKQNIWNRFYKIDKSRTTIQDNSSGLGLAISKKIVELHNGKIAILDNKPKGAKFVINF
ncbi:HAMP domain-containing sensor histidine kinase [Gemella cuniculi]|uniref:HAMP domain-containing sensor histidine kinase n=1 Tax=Gemella cuniculi TaxID=150240 RepID=UPI00041AEE15|nr:HAMP domain-containing sensor histidine kinase [Gemella cuniculi]